MMQVKYIILLILIEIMGFISNTKKSLQVL